MKSLWDSDSEVILHCGKWEGFFSTVFKNFIDQTIYRLNINFLLVSYSSIFCSSESVCVHTFNLQIRNKLNQEQNSKLQQQKELLNKRNMEVTLMDKRISELRERLYKKKAEARQKENLPVRLRAHSTPPL